MRNLLLSIFIVVSLLFGFNFLDSYAVMPDRPGPEPKIEGPGGELRDVVDECLIYQASGWSDCGRVHAWAKRAQNPRQCFNCVGTCWFEARRGVIHVTTFCQRRCLTNGQCKF
ncbi:MAG: hypothetical protein QMD43_09125 [Thermodesulfovibrio sp.]|nr:hypothetical protein [Thermodesulfovibrio sp.]